MSNPLDFTGKVALVTGAAAGMGFATATAFAEAGAAVVLADFKEEAVKAAADLPPSASHGRAAQSAASAYLIIQESLHGSRRSTRISQSAADPPRCVHTSMSFCLT